MTLQPEVLFPAGCTVLWIQRADGSDPAWRPTEKPAELELLGQAQWEAFNASLRGYVGRLRHESMLCRPVLVALVWGLIGIGLAPLVEAHAWFASSGRRLVLATSSSAASSGGQGESQAPFRRTSTNMTMNMNSTLYSVEARLLCKGEKRNPELTVGDCRALCAMDDCCCGFTVDLNGFKRLEAMQRWVNTCELSLIGDQKTCAAADLQCEFAGYSKFYRKQEPTVCHAPEDDDFRDSDLLLYTSITGMCITLLSLLALVGSRYVCRRRNVAVDRMIWTACSELSDESGCSVEYVAMRDTLWSLRSTYSCRAVCFCKRKVDMELSGSPEQDMCIRCSTKIPLGELFCVLCDTAPALMCASKCRPQQHFLDTKGRPHIEALDLLCPHPADFFVRVGGFAEGHTPGRLGLRVEDVCEGLRVLEVLPGGLVAAWNDCKKAEEKAPKLCVQAGDIVLAVNGICGNHDAMLSIMISEVNIELAMLRDSTWLLATPP
eukprot:TRINITY_DN16316_c0_g1_i1.p1 TRINITY_DN16316_c0_g1~~TRINITY_DN16316_c0_g1_i1.p1  ORF type:complete len:491 (-),score=60.55 TRINITY_DN16316_c0_g1_i1:61-1533(-)